MTHSHHHINLYHVLNTASIEDLRTEYLVSIIIERLIKFLLFREDETEFFDLTPYLREHKEQMDTVINRICEEIQKLDYKTGLSYGKTALFVYKSEVPENMW